MPGKRVFPMGLSSKGSQRIVTNSTATSLNSTCSGGSVLWLGVETQDIRVTLDGSTTPTANTGLLFAAGDVYNLEGIDASKVKIARAASGAIVNLQVFKRVGDQ